MKKPVATYVATPEHNQDTRDRLMDTHKKEKPNKTQRENVENLLVRLPLRPLG